jgi:transcription initiation factor IIF auxiliary subunit
MNQLLIKAVLAIMFLLSVITPMSGQDITVKNTSSLVGNGRWQWTVYIDGAPSILDKVKCVEYTLHPTFPNPLRVICERGPHEPFALYGNGWGEFNVGVKIKFFDRKEQTYNHWLKLVEPSKVQPPQRPTRTVPPRKQRG